MTTLGPARAIREVIEPVDTAALGEIRAAGQPVVLRGIVNHWPLVKASEHSNHRLVEYLCAEPARQSVGAIAAPPSEQGRFFYKPDLSGFNFHFGRGDLSVFLSDLLRLAETEDAPGMAIQSEDLSALVPRVAQENRLDLLPSVRPRIWIGNRIRVAPHYDLKENIACCVAGRRRFTVFPPDQTANLYPGPLELTPAGAPISMVDLAAPDLAAFPRFADAWAAAQSTELQPGDAIYLPYCWWHGVDSLDAVNILVNYWWTDPVVEGIGGAHDALLHAMFALRHLPPDQRAVWRDKFEFYVFGTADAGAHLPPHIRGVLGAPSPALFARMRAMLQSALSGRLP